MFGRFSSFNKLNKLSNYLFGPNRFFSQSPMPFRPGYVMGSVIPPRVVQSMKVECDARTRIAAAQKLESDITAQILRIDNERRMILSEYPGKDKKNDLTQYKDQDDNSKEQLDWLALDNLDYLKAEFQMKKNNIKRELFKEQRNLQQVILKLLDNNAIVGPFSSDSKSPVVWEETQIVYKDRGFDSIEVDATFHIKEEKTQSARDFMSDVQKSVAAKANTRGFWYVPSISAETSMSSTDSSSSTSTSETQQVEAVLVLTAFATHKKVQQLENLTLDPNALIDAYNYFNANLDKEKTEYTDNKEKKRKAIADKKEPVWWKDVYPDIPWETKIKKDLKTFDDEQESFPFPKDDFETSGLKLDRSNILEAWEKNGYNSFTNKCETLRKLPIITECVLGSSLTGFVEFRRRQQSTTSESSSRSTSQMEASISVSSWLGGFTGNTSISSAQASKIADMASSDEINCTFRLECRGYLPELRSSEMAMVVKEFKNFDPNSFRMNRQQLVEMQGKVNNANMQKLIQDNKARGEQQSNMATVIESTVMGVKKAESLIGTVNVLDMKTFMTAFDDYTKSVTFRDNVGVPIALNVSTYGDGDIRFEYAKKFLGVSEQIDEGVGLNSIEQVNDKQEKLKKEIEELDKLKEDIEKRDKPETIDETKAKVEELQKQLESLKDWQTQLEKQNQTPNNSVNNPPPPTTN